ncbi:glucose-dependent insulinotropic receptor-like isoform X2 [Coccinella septempunctata]|nr:glucose-dependent insulinotropic receptor-like isoform X2 [Coccinella septempunctata]XP_044746364.1 glucose-dependent insulinotropic receptor-like isoform X2 [Coccinella septempunctata]
MDNRSYYHHQDLTTDYAVEIGHGVFQKNPTDEKNANLLYNILIPLFGAIIIISNLVTFISSCVTIKKSTKPKLMYLLLGNIALADSLTGLVVIFGQVYPENLRDQQICAAQIGLIIASTLITIYTVGIIGIDRFLYIFYGYHNHKWFYSKIIYASIVIVWILSLLVGYLPLMGWSRTAKNQQACCFVVIVPETLILIIAILYIVPVTVILLLYSLVLYRASKKFSLQELLVGKPVSRDLHKRKSQMDKRKKIHEMNGGNQSKNCCLKILGKEFSPAVNNSKRWKAAKVVFFSTNNFLFTWFPYIIVSLYYTSVCIDDSSKRCRSLSLVLASPLAMLGFVNSLVSPIIYAWWHKGFNRYIKRRISTFRLRNPSHSKKIVPYGSSNATMTTILENSNEHITSV